MEGVLEEFLTYLEALGRADRTVATYRERLGYLCQFLRERGVREIGEVKPGDLDAYFAGQYRAGLSLATIAGRVQVAKCFFSWAVKRHHLSQSPASHLHKPRFQSRSEAMKGEDLVSLMEEAKRKAERGKPRDFAILAFLADTGVRIGELTSLRLSDLDLEQLEASVAGKSGRRPVYYTGLTAEALRAWLEVRDGIEGESVFGASNHAVRQLLKRLAKKAGVEGPCNPHAVRHLLGQSWADRRVNPELIRRKLGHRNIEVTLMFYSHQNGDRVKAATERFSLVRDDGTRSLEP